MMADAEMLIDRRGPPVLIVLVLTMVFGGVLWTLYWTRFGLDFTDEGFYLNFLSNPSAYRASTTQFGFVYAPFFAALGNDIVLARQANLVLTLSLATSLFYLLVPRSSRPVAGLGWLAISGLLAFAALVSMIMHTTPSYNSLNLQGMLSAGIAFILIRDDDWRRALVGSIVLGLAGSIVFLAKPPSGAFLGLVSLFYLLFHKGRDLRYLAAAGATAIVFILGAAFLIDGSLSVFFVRLAEGYRLNRLLQGYTLETLSPFDRLWPGIPPMLVWLVCLGFGFVSTTWALSKTKLLNVLVLGIALLLSGGALAIKVGYLPDAPLSVFMLVGFHCGLALAAGFRRFWQERNFILAWRELALAVTLASLPLIYAAGTNTNFWAMAARASVFWIAAAVLGLTSLHPRIRAWRSMLPLALISHSMTIWVLCGSILQPFLGSQPLPMNDRIVDLGKSGSSPILASHDAAYLGALRASAVAAGFKPNTPVIDLTGEFPTALFALNGLPIGQPWTIGGYPGSAARAKAALLLVPCELIASAWLLTEPESPRALVADSIDLTDYQYTQVATIASPRRETSQYLLKPHDAVANRTLCRKRRTGDGIIG